MAALTPINIPGIIKRVEDEVDDILDYDMILAWINGALEQIALFWGEIVPFEVNEGNPVVKDEWYDLPENFLKDVDVFETGTNKRCQSHIINAMKKISFKVGGRKYTVHYHRKARPVIGPAFATAVVRDGYYLANPEEKFVGLIVVVLNLPSPGYTKWNGTAWVTSIGEIDCDPLFHQAIIMWCKAEYWDFESDSDQIESAHANKFRELFYASVREIARMLTEENRRIPRDKRRLNRRLRRQEDLPIPKYSAPPQ